MNAWASPSGRVFAPGALVRLPAAGNAPRLGIVADIRPQAPTVWVFPYDEEGRLLVGADGAPRAAAYVLTELEPVQPDRRDRERTATRGQLAWRGAEAADSAAHGVGELRDVSLDGLGFMTAAPPVAGQEIVVEIATGRGGPAPLACVVRTVVRQEDGMTRVGCWFVRRVAPQDLAALLP